MTSIIWNRWEHLPTPFKGGQSHSGVPIRRCVYPSYGFNLPDITAQGTMIASYVWDQDSSHLGARLENASGRARLVDITLHGLATMNILPRLSEGPIRRLPCLGLVSRPMVRRNLCDILTLSVLKHYSGADDALPKWAHTLGRGSAE
jgi:hypothetical protein